MSMDKPDDNCSFQEWFSAMASVNLRKLSEQLKAEFEEMQNEVLMPHEHTEFSKNSFTGRVRYSDIPCLDISRVKLRFPVDGNDFIHANWVHLRYSPFTFIITQAPLEATISHFWSMVWYEEVSAVVCLTPITEQNEPNDRPYWPVKPGEDQFIMSGEILLQHLDKIMQDELQITLLRLVNKSTGESRELYHYMFMNWPDHASPTCTHTFLEAMETIEKNSLRENENKKPINVLEVVKAVRKQRALVVQSFPQYAFLHWALLVHMMKKDSNLKSVLEKSCKTICAIREWSTDSECMKFAQVKRKTIFGRFNQRVKGMFSKMSLRKQKKPS
ncbi:Receptor-type tyrosine-protein phosphatase eta [Trichinella pseudospiralis]